MSNEPNENPMWLAREAISKMNLREVEADEVRVRNRIRVIVSSPEIEPGTPERNELEREKLWLSTQQSFHEHQRIKLKFMESERGLAGVGSPLHQIVLDRLDPALVAEIEAAALVKREEARKANFGKSNEDEQRSHVRWLVEFAGWVSPAQ
jgi:hypothetical protein